MATEIANQLWQDHKVSPIRIQAINLFMAYLMGCGVVQFVFCLLMGNYPFNAFLAGFGTNIAQFVLLANLRQQINPVNQIIFAGITQKRAFMDFLLGSVILHFLAWHFIN